MELYKLKKNIDSPQFNHVLEAGKLYPESVLVNHFPSLDKKSPRFKEFFEISEEYEIEHCRIVKKRKSNLVHL